MANNSIKNRLNCISKSAPQWMQNVTASLTILLASKGILIDGIPGLDDAMKALAGEWFDYVANWIAIAFAIAMIFSQQRQK